MRGAVFPLPLHAFIAWCSVLKKHKENFTFVFNYTTASNLNWVGIVTRLRAGRPGFYSWQEQERDTFFITASRLPLRPTRPPIQGVTGSISPGVKGPGREADHSPPSCAEVSNRRSYISTPPYVLMA